MKTNRLTLAANDAADATLLANATENCSPFAILQGDSFFVPYGDYPHKLGKQKFDRAAAERMAANHNGLVKRLVSWALGESPSYPVYIGHPDLPGSKDIDKKSYGWVENMIPEETGMRLPVKWSDAGRELVENAHFKFYSPLWWTRPVKGGIQPVAFKSMGLTNDPNIPVPALANEYEDTKGYYDARDYNPEKTTEESQTIEESMKPKLLEALGLEETAGDEEILAKIVSLKEAVEAAENAEKPDPDAMKKMEDEKAEYEEKARLAEEEKTAANEKVTELETRCELLAANAIEAAAAAGKITPAEKDAKKAELLAANDFAAALQDLGKLPAKFKTESKVGDLGEGKARLHIAANDEGAAAKAERAQLVENEFQRINPDLSIGARKRLAYQRAAAKNPELFGKKPSSDPAA